MFIGDFRRVFRGAAYSFSSPPKDTKSHTRVTWMKLSSDLYNAHLSFFRRTAHLVENLEVVMDDFEHQLSMEEGMELGFALPNQEDFREFIAEYREHFEDFNPFSAHRQDGEVWLSGDKILAFSDNRELAATLYEMLDEAIFQTEYMDLIRHLKNVGVPYAGPTIFQDIMDWQVEAAQLLMVERDHITSKNDAQYAVWNAVKPDKSKPPHILRRDEVENPGFRAFMDQFMADMAPG